MTTFVYDSVPNCGVHTISGTIAPPGGTCVYVLSVMRQLFVWIGAI